MQARIRRSRATPSLGAMAVKEGPVPPFPDGADPDEYDRLRRRVLWKMPSRSLRRRLDRRGRAPQRHDAQLGDAGLVRAEVARHRGRARRVHARAHRGRRRVQRSASSTARTGRSSASSRSRSRSTSRRSTLNGFPYLDGPATGAPVLAQSVAYLECEVRQPVEVGNHTLFLGEIVERRVPEGRGDTEVLRMEDTRMNYGG